MNEKRQICRGTEMPTIPPVEEHPPTSTFIYPMHPPLREPEWYGCKHPERPVDQNYRVDWRCRICILTAESVLATHGDCLIDIREADGTVLRDVPWSWAIRRARYWLTRANGGVG